MRRLMCAMVWAASIGVALLAGCSSVIVDSNLTRRQAVCENQPPDVSPDAQERLELVDVRYYGFDGKEHQGQVVINKGLAGDIRKVFAVILESRFPVASVLPVAHPEIQKKGLYGLSPNTNNTSAYVWRPVTGGRKPSMHSFGLAIDINPRQNPYIRGERVLPPGSRYDPTAPGTLTPDSPVVRAFKAMGWTWGGDWAALGLLDYMHFEKIPPDQEDWVRRRLVGGLKVDESAARRD